MRVNYEKAAFVGSHFTFAHHDVTPCRSTYVAGNQHRYHHKWQNEMQTN